MSEAGRSEVLAYIGLGANLGDAQATVAMAITQVAAMPHTRLVTRSSLYRSAPVAASGPDYFNAVISILSRLNAHEMLLNLQQIERMAGRERPYLNAPRTLDLDLLLYGSGSIHCASLVVPHPRMTERAFVLQPLAEIAPEQVSAYQLAAVVQQRIDRV